MRLGMDQAQELAGHQQDTAAVAVEDTAVVAAAAVQEDTVQVDTVDQDTVPYTASMEADWPASLDPCPPTKAGYYNSIHSNKSCIHTSF